MTEVTHIVQKRASDTLALEVPKVVNHPWVLGPRPGSSTRVHTFLRKATKISTFVGATRTIEYDRLREEIEYAEDLKEFNLRNS